MRYDQNRDRLNYIKIVLRLWSTAQMTPLQDDILELSDLKTDVRGKYERTRNFSYTY